jgi:ATP-dependent Clp protease adaptor protein ClpS
MGGKATAPGHEPRLNVGQSAPNPFHAAAPVAATRMIFMASPTPTPPPVAPKTRPADDDGGSVVVEKQLQKTQPPQMYQVVMLNDDYTPMEFVVVVIQEFFNKDRETATQIMLKIHLDGKGVCGVYSKDVAATKVHQVQEAARQAGHPLQCLSEPVE